MANMNIEAFGSEAHAGDIPQPAINAIRLDLGQDIREGKAREVQTILRQAGYDGELSNLLTR